MSDTATEPSETTATAPADLPAVREELPITELDAIARRGQWLAALEGRDLADKRAGAAAAWRIWIAMQLDLGPQGVSELQVIDGKLSLSAELLRALAARDGYVVTCEHITDESCTAAIWRGGEKLGESDFTMADAQRAGLASKHNWKTYPRRMLWARASAYAIRDFAPGVALGFRTTEEMGGVTPSSEPIRRVDELLIDGDVIDVDAETLGDLVHEGDDEDGST